MTVTAHPVVDAVLDRCAADLGDSEAPPYAGFHRQILGGRLAHAVRHPARPFPMMKL
ncbi:hypothetical protein [Nocardioides sp. LML1-1-1.1]|uniref:hypothetical protein n=1 Tax=Nocardioides sp. LML1-1-1.1 TaxID=3135248 RepID=UPI00341AECF5